MTAFRCIVPLQLRIAGDFDEEAAVRLERALAPVVRDRLRMARTRVSERVATDLSSCLNFPEFHVTGEADEAQQERIRSSVVTAIARAASDTGLVSDGSASPFGLAGSGRPSGGPAARVRARRLSRPWYVRKAIHFHAGVREFLSVITRLSPHLSPLIDLYAEYFDESRWVGVWDVQVNRSYELAELMPLLRARVAALGNLRSDETIGEAAAPGEFFREALIAIDRDGVVSTEIRSLVGNGRFYTNDGAGRITLRPGCRLLYAWMVVPFVTFEGRAEVGASELHEMPLDEIASVVDADAFRAEYGVSLTEFVRENPSQLATVVILPIRTSRRVPYVTLGRLAIDYVDAHQRGPGLRVGEFILLNQTNLDELPSRLRSALASHSDDATRTLAAGTGAFWWETNWRGALYYVIVDPTEEQLEITRYRPIARRAADRMIRRLALDPRELAWPYDVLADLSDTFDSLPSVALELFLDDLVARDSFDRFFDAIAARENGNLIRFVVDRARATRYALNPRVSALHHWMNEERRRNNHHTYRIAEQEIWLDHDPDKRVRVGDYLADVAPIYSVEETKKVLKEPRRAVLQEAILRESRELVGRIERGEDTEIYEADDFLREVFERAAAAVNLSDEDFEELHIERTFRLLGLVQREEESMNVSYVRYDVGERIDGGPWVPVPGTETTLRDHLAGGHNGFELTIWFWAYNKAAVVVEAFAIGVTAIAVIAVAWEVGLVAALVQAAGGAGTVLVAIGISELIYLLRVIFTDETLTFEGFLTSALEGYLFALGFRGAGLIGRGLGGSIGTATLRRLIVGWAVERLAVGTIGGASSAVLVMFAQDSINILLGRHDRYRSFEEYVEGMAWGALFGVVFEFGIGALQPVLRAGGETGLQSIRDVVRAVRQAGLSAEQWAALSTEALGAMRTRLVAFLDEAIAGRIAAAMRVRILQTLEWYGGQTRLALFRRVLELSPEALSRGAVEGLERLLVLSPRHMADDAVLSVLNSVSGARLRTFLEVFHAAETDIAEQIVRGRGLQAVAAAPNVLAFVQRDVVMNQMVRELATLAEAAAVTRLGRLLAVAAERPAIPESFTRGAVLGEGGTNIIYRMAEDAALAIKPPGGRLAREARALIEMEMMGIETVYAGTVEVGGRLEMVMRRIEGAGSKDMIGRPGASLNPYRYTEYVTQRTIDDLHRIREVLRANSATVGDFQFIIRASDGAVFVNDPVSLTIRSAPRSSGAMENIIATFESILSGRTGPGPGGRPSR